MTATLDDMWLDYQAHEELEHPTSAFDETADFEEERRRFMDEDAMPDDFEPVP